MLTTIRLLSLLLILFCGIASADDVDEKKPDKKSDYQVTIKGEVNDQLGPVAGKLTEVFFDSYPKLVKRFDNPDKPAPRHITVVFKSKIRVPAYCTGDTVTVSVEWLTQHPEDLGMLTHELTHAVQGYPNPDPGWITEGIADYTRKVYGPKEQPNWELPKTLTAKNSYRESYRVAARFFEWLDEKHPEAVDKIHRKMQKGEFVTEDFERITGAPLDTLWEQCVEELGKAK